MINIVSIPPGPPASPLTSQPNVAIDIFHPLLERRGQVIEAFGKQKLPSQVSRELVNEARAAGSGDDITAVVAKLG